MKAGDKNKKFAWLLIVLMVLVLMTACSGQSGDDGKSNEAAGTGSAGSQETTAAEGAGGAGDSSEPVELTLFINHPWYPIKEWTGPIADKITEKTGVKLKVTVAADDKQLPTMIASGELPDLIFTDNTGNNIDRLSDPNISYPLNELIQKYAPDFKIDPIRITVNTADDGNFYTIRDAFSTKEEWDANKYALGNDGNPGIAIREDLVQEMGNPPLKTLDDLVNLLGMVKEKYPDMVPLVMDKNWIEPYFMTQFGVEGGLGSWYETDGKVHYGLNNPKLLDYFKFMNNLYRKGYILAENFAFANDQIDDEYTVGGKAFMHSHTVSVGDRNNIAAEQKGLPYKFKMIPEVLSKDAKVVSTGIGWSGTFITKNNKNPEKSIKFLQYLASPEGLKLTMFGIEGEHWTWNEEGYPNLKYRPADSDFVNKNGIKWWGLLYTDAVTEGLWNYVPGTQTTQALVEIKNITEFKPTIGLIQLKADSKEQIMKTKIDEMVKNQKVKIYLAKSDAELMKAYEDMINTAKKIGMDKVDEYANQVYAQKKSLLQ
ncbi:extracellular solute-binding protein [Paenibacillus sp. sptzw28]|uniref:extracellular solute-binding protein n=1 Tax=Paenibacillus sp. sptzw28 TaxID=715179 RepID=UPI0021619BD0|nr:extracellular solute-binding protein [Paenibacillus sp. sptzw28]